MTNAFFGTPNNVKTKDELTQLLTCRLFIWEVSHCCTEDGNFIDGSEEFVEAYASYV